MLYPYEKWASRRIEPTTGKTTQKKTVKKDNKKVERQLSKGTSLATLEWNIIF